MKYLRGMVVRLKPGAAKYSGTDDPLYIGVAGTAGGLEFPLNVPWFDDFERASDVRYVLGDVWEEAAVVGAKQPAMSDKDWNDPQLAYVGFDEIDRVYLRKHAGGRTSDDAYQLDLLEVRLFGEEPGVRVFRTSTAVGLGFDYGHQLWVPEVR